ncbi:MAG: TetR/AcrR family transcriptional regulator [Acidimicrobiales bacterium]
MPTGIALTDARERLFEAAERVLVDRGPGGLTSRAVTAEAGVAKGVLHRHFADFDDFLAAFVLDRTGRLDEVSAGLLQTAGTKTVVANLTNALLILFGPVTVGIVALVISRDGLRHRLADAGASRLPLIQEATAMIAGYLGAERDRGRIRSDADVGTLAPTLIGAVHLLFTDREASPPRRGALTKVVATVMAGALSESE